MRILLIPDVHGRDYWKERVARKDFDRVIFLGDYLDESHPYIEDEDMLENFADIISYAKANKNVTLLLGNHDLHYKYTSRYRCSRYRPSIYDRAHALFELAGDIVRICDHHEEDGVKYLFTHAGVSAGWYKRCGEFFKQELEKPRSGSKDRLDSERKELDELTRLFDSAPVWEVLDAMYRSESQRDGLFEVGRSRGGWAHYGGPCWADQSETEVSFLRDHFQFVGHSRVRNVTERKTKDGTTGITYCDCHDYRNEYVMIDTTTKEVTIPIDMAPKPPVKIPKPPKKPAKFAIKTELQSYAHKQQVFMTNHIVNNQMLGSLKNTIADVLKMGHTRSMLDFGTIHDIISRKNVMLCMQPTFMFNLSTLTIVEKEPDIVKKSHRIKNISVQSYQFIEQNLDEAFPNPSSIYIVYMVTRSETPGSLIIRMSEIPEEECRKYYEMKVSLERLKSSLDIDANDADDISSYVNGDDFREDIRMYKESNAPVTIEEELIPPTLSMLSQLGK